MGEQMLWSPFHAMSPCPLTVSWYVGQHNWKQYIVHWRNIKVYHEAEVGLWGQSNWPWHLQNLLGLEGLEDFALRGGICLTDFLHVFVYAPNPSNIKDLMDGSKREMIQKKLQEDQIQRSWHHENNNEPPWVGVGSTSPCKAIYKA